MLSNRAKSNQLAFILSGLMPGLGQFYNADWAKGGAFFFGSIVLEGILIPESYIDLMKGNVPWSVDLLGRLLLSAAFRIGCVYDADRSAKRKNTGGGSKTKTP